MISDPKFKTAKDWFEKLRVNLIDTLQTIEKKEFEIIPWDHNGEGGGIIGEYASMFSKNVLFFIQ